MAKRDFETCEFVLYNYEQRPIATNRNNITRDWIVHVNWIENNDIRCWLLNTRNKT